MKKTNLHIKKPGGQTKIRQLVQSITEAISTGKLKVGDSLPSVNQLSNESGYSRDTVFKAYNILKQQNLVESAPQKGYFVASESFKVFMLLDDFSAFKEQLYQSFRQNLPDSCSVDLLFHHYNPEVFQQLIENSLGRYSQYIIMNIDHLSIHPVLEKIDSNKLLVLDMGKPRRGKMNFLIQDFNKSVQKCLFGALEKLRNYSELIMVYEQKNTPHPIETVSAVKSFCQKHKIAFRNLKEISADEVVSGRAFFVIRDSDLVNIIKTCRSGNLKVGKDVGIISYNDTPMKEIVGGGISVISTNFELMGEKAARFVKKIEKPEEILPTSLILRDSL